MAEIEQAAAAAIAADLDAGDATATSNAATVPLNGAGDTLSGGLHSSSSTRPMDGGQGMNAGAGTRPLGDGWNVTHDADKVRGGPERGPT